MVFSQEKSSINTKPLILRKKKAKPAANRIQSQLSVDNTIPTLVINSGKQFKTRRKEKLTERLKSETPELAVKTTVTKAKAKTGKSTDASAVKKFKSTGTSTEKERPSNDKDNDKHRNVELHLQLRLLEMEKQGLTFGYCKICLDVGHHKKLWDKYYPLDNICDADECISYGEMIMECFSVNIHFEDYSKSDLLCTGCISKLNTAESLRKSILESKAFLVEIPKEELFDSQDEHSEDGEDETNEGLTEDKDYQNNKNAGRKIVEAPVQSKPKLPQVKERAAPVPEVVEDIEYVKCEPELQDVGSDDEEESSNAASDDGALNDYAVEVEYLEEEGDNDAPPPPPPYRRTGKGSRASYKTYTTHTLHRCLRAVQQGMSTNAAAKLFNIPRRSIGFHIDRGTQFLDPNECTLGDEIKLILRHTNATPFALKYNNRLGCVICNAAVASARHFREHVVAAHGLLEGEEKLAKIHARLYTHWEKYTVRLDIKDLRCTECGVSIPSWPDLFDHLSEAHGCSLVEARTRVIPYRLEDSAHDCVLCDKVFTTFKELDAHMSAHYPNYICSHCGESFLSSDRYEKHQKYHENATYPCHFCGKIFFVELYRKKHEDAVHVTSSSYKCKFCDKQLAGYSERRAHVQLEHPLEVKYIACELCGDTFTWKPAFYAHLQEAHLDQMKHACSMCPKVFFTQRQLKRHMIFHRIHKPFKCDKCNKGFVTEWSLVLHSRTHSKRKARTMDMDLAEQTAKKIAVGTDSADMSDGDE